MLELKHIKFLGDQMDKLLKIKSTLAAYTGLRSDPDRISLSLDVDNQTFTIVFNMGLNSKWLPIALRIFDQEKLTPAVNSSATSSTTLTYQYRVVNKAGPVKVTTFIEEINNDKNNNYLKDQIAQVQDNLRAVTSKTNFGKNIDAGMQATNAFGGSKNMTYGSSNNK
jgi:hypothetical protein